MQDNGKSISVEDLCDDTWRPLYQFVYYKVQNREEAEDVTQETYMKAIHFLQKGSIDPEKHLGFLKTVAMNVLRDKWRKKKRSGVEANIEHIPPMNLAMEDSTAPSAQKIVLENAMGKLSKEHRTIIELRILKGFSVFDTAKIMNKKEGTIRVIQHRALQKLADILKKEDQMNEY